MELWVKVGILAEQMLMETVSDLVCLMSGVNDGSNIDTAVTNEKVFSFFLN